MTLISAAVFVAGAVVSVMPATAYAQAPAASPAACEFSVQPPWQLPGGFVAGQGRTFGCGSTSTEVCVYYDTTGPDPAWGCNEAADGDGVMRTRNAACPSIELPGYHVYTYMADDQGHSAESPRVELCSG